jgi:hypothetical protein
MSEEKRVYVIVAETVQNPCNVILTNGRAVLEAGVDVQTIVQPKGRIAAQVGHVVSKMRLNETLGRIRAIGKIRKDKAVTILSEEVRTPYTTIILGVPDSFQLMLRQCMLQREGVPTYLFFDENEEYGPGVVKTAICTPPVIRTEVGGALDYLNLWS